MIPGDPQAPIQFHSLPVSHTIPSRQTLPSEIPRPNEEQQQSILDLLKEENDDVQSLQDLLEIIKKNNIRMIKKYDRRAAPWEQEQQAFGDNANNRWGQQ